MSDALTVNIVANEVLALGAPIEVTSAAPLDPRSAQAAIVLAGERTLIDLSEDRRTARVCGADGGCLAPGRHVLVVEELLSEGRNRVSADLCIPFLVSDTRAEIPGNLRVDAMVRLGVEELRTVRLRTDRRPDGPYIEMFKAADRDTGEPVELAFDHEGRRIDAGAMLEDVRRKRLDRFGKLQEELHEQIERDPSATVTVAVWLRTAARERSADKSPHAVTTEPPEHERREAEDARAASRRFAAVAEDAYGAVVDDPDPDAPMLIATLPASQVRAMAQRDEVAAVFLHATDSILDLGDSIAIAHSDDVQAAGIDGTGVNLAVWENGPDQVTLLPITATFDPAFAGGSQHARHTHGIVANTESGLPHGHAPGCSLHSANRDTIAALRWAVRDRRCTVISQSFHRSTEPSSGNLQSDDVYKDWLALRQPYPTIVQAAGNYWSTDPDGIMPPESEFVNHKTYNGLTVGNHDDLNAAMSGDSVFRNPTTVRGDRELPEVAANGTSVTTVGLTMSGTSMAAPAAAGCVALLQEADATLKSWPEGCRAIVLAGARRIPGSPSWYGDVQAHTDVAQGAGAVDADESLRITRLRRGPGAKPTAPGWDVGTLRTADISGDTATFSYRVGASALMPRPLIKAVLAWDSTVGTVTAVGTGRETPLTSSLGIDLDLLVHDATGNLVAQSSTYENSYEIVEYACRPGEQFTLTIRRFSGTDDVWFGIAWSVRSRSIFLG